MWTFGPAWRDEQALAVAWRAAQPFPHLILDDVVAERRAGGDARGGARRALRGRHLLLRGDGARALADVQAAFGAQLAPSLARITGKPVARAELRAYAYRPGHFLLPHSDHQDGLRRLLAFAYYLPTPAPPRGGELELYRCTMAGGEIVATESVATIEPRAHRLVVFDVSDVTLHQVREVLGGLRLSLAGWFYP